MALTLEQKKKLLKRSTSERAKKHASSGENFSYFDNDKVKKYGFNFIRPKAREDAYYFNFIPYINSNEEDEYVLVTKVHRINVNGVEKNVLCPKAMSNGVNPCPICEKRQDKMVSDPDDKAGIDALRVKEREVYYVEDVSNKTEKAKGIQLFEVAATFMGWKVKPLCKPKIGGEGVKGNKGYIDPSDFENGRTISFNVGTKTIEIGKSKVTIPDYTGHSLEERDPISDSLLEKALELPPLESLVQIHTYDELYEMINNESPSDRSNSSSDDDDSNDDDDNKEEKENKKSSLKSKVDKFKKKKEKKVDLDFDWKNSDADELEDYISEYNVEIDEDDIGNEKKMKLAIKKFIKEMSSQKTKSWPNKDEINDIDEFMDENEDDLKAFCDHHGIEYLDEDVDEYRDAIDEWYIED